MSLPILVTNRPPETDGSVSQPLKELFQAYTRAKYEQVFPPFCHQAEVFRLIAQGEEVFLVAGTAAGKTLAIAVPLFHKLKTECIRKALLMYPTIALMNDQRQVMDTLAEITGLETGQIQGGMSRTKLIAALNKPLILATPDAVYWFFQKNVKYSGMLLYGLALVDEWVLDEAHLFNGLMLQNLRRLKDRLVHLSEMLGRKPRWHILTATPTPELRALTQGKRVDGASKCGNVQVTFVGPLADYKERDSTVCQVAEDALANSKRKVLVVLNSARGAHYLFNEVKGSPPALTPEQWLRFGNMVWKDLRPWLQASGLDKTIEPIETWLGREMPFYPVDLAKGMSVSLPTDKLMASLTDFLEGKVRLLVGLAYEAVRSNEMAVTGVHKRLPGRGRATRAVWNAVAGKTDTDDSPDNIKACLHRWVEGVTDQLDEMWSDSIEDTPPDFRQLRSNLNTAGLGTDLAELAVRNLLHQVPLTPDDVGGVKPPGSSLDKRNVYLRWLLWPSVIPTGDLRTELEKKLKAALANRVLEPKSPYVATWRDSGVPVVLYSGKMSKRARDGLVELFGALEEQAVLISTPAVEVGVDFDAEVLITEECDGNGFLQRFGRVGRSGDLGEVTVLLRNPGVLPRLRDASSEMSREEFSRFIVNPDDPTKAEHSLFPARAYVPDSALIGAVHWLINEQIGEIGIRLNQAMFPSDAKAVNLARKMQIAAVPFRYGLRGTLPEIALRDGAGGDPFYVLSRVHNIHLRPASSPFEAARAETGYGRFIYLPFGWHVSVDWEQTIECSEYLLYRLDGEWYVAAGAGIVRDYLESTGSHLSQWVKPARALWRKEPDRARELLKSQRHKRPFDLLARLGTAVLLHNTPAGRLLLGQGPIYLRREGKEDGAPEPVETALGEPISLPDQMWLVILGNKEDALARVDRLGLRDLEELYTDDKGQYIVLIERLAGACLYAYERLSDVG
jgi:hypothetical protein